MSTFKQIIIDAFNTGLAEFYGTNWANSALNIEINSTRISNPTQNDSNIICNLETTASIKLFNEKDLYEKILHEFLKNQCYPTGYAMNYQHKDMIIKGILSIEHLEEVRDTGFHYKITIKLLHGCIELNNIGELCS